MAACVVVFASGPLQMPNGTFVGGTSHIGEKDRSSVTSTNGEMGRTLVDSVSQYIQEHRLLDDGERVLVGVSGGVDSMVCTQVLRTLGYDVQVLHVNYGLREGADEEEALVREWCADQTPPVPVHVVSLDAEGRAEERDESLQEAARVLRYNVLADRANEIGANVVATGHHRDDQAETLLLNLLRGSGPEGLAGMSPSRPMAKDASVVLVRPFLGVSRTDIKRYATARDVPWRDDPSNRDPAFDRAVIRTKILPLLEEEFDGASANLARCASLLREYVEQTLSPALTDKLSDCYVECQDGAALRLAPLSDEPAVWRRRLILAALERTFPEAPQSYALAEEVDALVGAQVGRRVELGTGTIWRERDTLRIVPEYASPPPADAHPVPWNEDVSLPQGTLRVESVEERPDRLDASPRTVEYVDADRLAPPLTARSWQEGDRLQPLGLDGSKPVSDLLTDADVPPHRRQAVCVLTTADHIAWVIGYRIDDRVRVRPSTTSVARLTWDPIEKETDDCNSP